MRLLALLLILVMSGCASPTANIIACGRIVDTKDDNRILNEPYERKGSREQFEYVYLKVNLIKPIATSVRIVTISVAQPIPLAQSIEYSEKMKKLRQRGTIIRFKVPSAMLSEKNNTYTARINLDEVEIIQLEDIPKT